MSAPLSPGVHGSIYDEPYIVGRSVYPGIPAGFGQTVHNKSTRLCVAAAGRAPLRFQWAWQATNRLQGTNAFLTLRKLREPDAGMYQVTVSNALGSVRSATSAVTVVNNDPPVQPTFATSGADLVLAWPETCADHVLGQSVCAPSAIAQSTGSRGKPVW